MVRIFPNRTSCRRLAEALAMEQSEDWLTGHHNLDAQAFKDEAEIAATTTSSAFLVHDAVEA